MLPCKFFLGNHVCVGWGYAIAKMVAEISGISAQVVARLSESGVEIKGESTYGIAMLPPC